LRPPRPEKKNPAITAPAANTPRYFNVERKSSTAATSLYSFYYNHTRTHLGLGKDAPRRRAVEQSGTVVAIPILSGLHHRYARI
jgi:hypothetical protein